MLRTRKINILALLVFGIIFVFGDYVIVIGQTSKRAGCAEQIRPLSLKGQRYLARALVLSNTS